MGVSQIHVTSCDNEVYVTIEPPEDRLVIITIVIKVKVVLYISLIKL